MTAWEGQFNRGNPRPIASSATERARRIVPGRRVRQYSKQLRKGLPGCEVQRC
jgi:hypothetical protein